ncbi:ABC transporter ATP-binding protein [Paenibacillus sp. Marseille-Q4541]|uniref:ABC transporter ATP-binding protein n=1 Tax=Paenibacillus sp. Marseille-Q4541 TaxID=2831522 RepID=UPI001BAA07D9|nr:ABC transporter ATP-binding protein [Paenibacillus sp. Marseille-Q4541]
MNVLAVKNLSYVYDGTKKKVLNEINIEFEPKKTYAIVGKSGSGKTTLLALLSGLDLCKEGEILYNGENIKKIDRDNYRSNKIGVIFQSYNLLTNATAIDNIMLSIDISGMSVTNKKQYAYSLLQSVGIDKETADRKVLKLSGGEQQRIGIARALSHNPGIIIADEPTGNLDTETEDSIMKILTSLSKKENKCVIIVTHSKKVADYADEIWGISDGKLALVKKN